MLILGILYSHFVRKGCPGFENFMAEVPRLLNELNPIALFRLLVDFNTITSGEENRNFFLIEEFLNFNSIKLRVSRERRYLLLPWSRYIPPYFHKKASLAASLRWFIFHLDRVYCSSSCHHRKIGVLRNIALRSIGMTSSCEVALWYVSRDWEFLSTLASSSALSVFISRHTVRLLSCLMTDSTLHSIL